MCMGICVTTAVAPAPTLAPMPADDWGYEDHNGPEKWMENFPVAATGTRQSPIDIDPSSVTLDVELSENQLTWDYDPQNCRSLLNTGRGWKVNVQGNDSILSGGPLANNYRLLQFHSHWGKSSDCGSEHTVGGKSYAGEIHLVHWNFEKYSSPAEAASAEDGLAVLGIFFEIGEPHPELQKLVIQIDCVESKGEECDLNNEVDPSGFIPENQSYWTYDGSLTTPPCSESVTWIVFKNPVQVSEEQLKAFRRLNCFGKDCGCPEGEFEGKTLENFRPPQQLKGRTVREVIY